MISTLLVAGCAHDRTNRIDAHASEIAAFVDDCEARHICNGTYLVARGDRVIFAGAAGDAGDEAQTALTSAYQFDIGSISKQMTAVAVLRLVEHGHLRLNDRVNAHLPDFPYRDITVQHLLSHSSGMPDILGQYGSSLRQLPEGRIIDGADVVDRYAALDLPLEFAPGSRFRYNNSGYLILARLVEQISGEGFAQHLERHLFTPAAMAHTRVRTASTESAIVLRAYGFVRAEDGSRRAVDQIRGFYIRGAGGIYSTAEDLLRWQRALVSGRLISAAMWRSATTPVRLSDGSTSPYGFGFSLRPLAEVTSRISHSGHWRGFKSDLSYFPQSDITIIQLTNNSQDDSVDENLGSLFALANAARR